MTDPRSVSPSACRPNEAAKQFHVPTSKVLDTDVVLLSDPFIHLGHDADLEVSRLILVVTFYHFVSCLKIFLMCYSLIFLEYYHFQG